MLFASVCFSLKWDIIALLTSQELREEQVKSYRQTSLGTMTGTGGESARLTISTQALLHSGGHPSRLCWAPAWVLPSNMLSYLEVQLLPAVAHMQSEHKWALAGKDVVLGSGDAEHRFVTAPGPWFSLAFLRLHLPA